MANGGWGVGGLHGRGGQSKEGLGCFARGGWTRNEVEWIKWMVATEGIY